MGIEEETVWEGRVILGREGWGMGGGKLVEGVEVLLAEVGGGEKKTDPGQGEELDLWIKVGAVWSSNWTQVWSY